MLEGSVMKRWSTISVVVLVGLVACWSSRTPVLGQTPSAWTVLFDGKSLDSFNPIGNANWKIAEGTVQADMGTGFLVSKASYGDFEFKADFWVTDDANSGVFIRCENPAQVTAMNAYEVNIFDKRPDQTYRTGAIVDVAKPMNMTMTTGNKWNTIEITAKGPRMTVAINGTPMVDAQDTKHARGPIALQYGAGTVKFRNVQIR
jgi:3-keto-disaccharide hydrolase